MNKVVVSLTSYPARIRTINRVLDSVINQTVLPDKIILYLSIEEFQGYNIIPNLEFYQKYGFEIRWCKENLGPHKKWYYSMQKYYDDLIITIDDDVCYGNTMIEELMNCHKRYPKAIIARRVHLVTSLEDGKIAPYNEWYYECEEYVEIPRMDLIATGCKGVLYPSNVFDKEIFHKEVFMEKAPFADDLWLKVMELYSGIPTVLAQNACDDKEIEECQKTALSLNQNANGGNDVQMNCLLENYNGCFEKKDFLTSQMFLDGRITINDLKKIKKAKQQLEMQEIVNNFLKMFEHQNRLLVYGAGNVATWIYRIFEKNGYLNKIKAFIVENKEKNPRQIGGGSCK